MDRTSSYGTNAVIFHYPYFSIRFFECFGPLLLLVITTHIFATPFRRPWWLAVISSVWVMFCLVLAFLLYMGESANFWNPHVISPIGLVYIIAGGWFISGMALIWVPEILRRLIHRLTSDKTAFCRGGFSRRR